MAGAAREPGADTVSLGRGRGAASRRDAGILRGGLMALCCGLIAVGHGRAHAGGCGVFTGGLQVVNGVIVWVLAIHGRLPSSCHAACLGVLKTGLVQSGKTAGFFTHGR